MTSKDKWKKDKKRIKVLKNKGFKTLVIWENDIKTKPEEIEKVILKFLKTANK